LVDLYPPLIAIQTTDLTGKLTVLVSLNRVAFQVTRVAEGVKLRVLLIGLNAHGYFR